ncbi:MAG: glycosyl transferase, partial [Vampirovibrionia bacterium]
TIFTAAYKLKAKCLIVVDSDLRSITPGWFENLAKPILLYGEDFVTPFYTRDKYDGMITNILIYGLTCALYGFDIRQPIGGNYGLSARLNESYLVSNDWDGISTVSEYGIDIWMTTLAAANKFNICQTFLGAKVHDVNDPGELSAPMFRQVVGTLFNQMKQYQEDWKKITEVKPVKKYGFVTDVSTESLMVNRENMLNKLKEGWSNNQELWQSVLRRDVYNALRDEVTKDEPHIPPALWINIVFDYSIAFNFSAYSKDKDFIETLIPLYLGRTGAFVKESAGMNQQEAEEVFQELCILYQQMKPDLIRLWKSAMVSV